jgi:hypothetical protein
MAEKAWLRFNGRFDAEIEAMAKVSVAELRPTGSFRRRQSVEVAERLARMPARR